MIVVTYDTLYLETCYDEVIFSLSYLYNYNNLSLNFMEIIEPKDMLLPYNIITRDYITHDGIVYSSNYMNIEPPPVSFTKMKCVNRIDLRNTEVSIYFNTGRIHIDNVKLDSIILNPIYSKNYINHSSRRFMGKLIRDTYNISNYVYKHDGG